MATSAMTWAPLSSFDHPPTNTSTTDSGFLHCFFIQPFLQDFVDIQII
jgi:hypothetical protein